jgi:hypothetical protein
MFKTFRLPDGTSVVRLKRALYGLVQSAKLWNEELSNFLVSIGFVANKVDQCVLNIVRNGSQCTVLLYVDDILVTSFNVENVQWVYDQLLAKYKGVKIQYGPAVPFLGMSMDFSVPGEVNVKMPKYVQELLEPFKTVAKPVPTPAAANLFDQTESDPLNSVERALFHTIVAKLLYLAKRVRPDILLPVNVLCSRTQEPTQSDQRKLMRIIHYLSGSPDTGITLQVAQSVPSIFIDTSFGVHPDGKSHSGAIVTLGAGPLVVKSTKQRIVTKSSTEAEIVAVSDMAGEIISVQEFLKEQGVAMSEPSVVFQDNTSCISLLKSAVGHHGRTKHMAIREFWIRDKIRDGVLKVEYLKTSDMVADILTKPLQGSAFVRLRAMLLNQQMPIKSQGV